MYQRGYYGQPGWQTINSHVNIHYKLPDDNFTKDQLSKSNYQRLCDMARLRVPLSCIASTVDVLWDMRKFVVASCYEFPYLEPTFDDSLETWLERSNYSALDKIVFRNLMEQRSDLQPEDRKCKCFIKAETYPEFKYPRPIKSRSNRFKAKMGPIFQGINDCLFSQIKYFIKKIPVNERPKHLFEALGLGSADETDFSAFESHFIDIIIWTIEIPFYHWCLQSLSCQWFKDELETLLKPNRCIFKDFVIDSMSRASGEMNTSSGNGFANKTLFHYTSIVKGAKRVVGKFEGDDGLTKVFPEHCAPTADDYTDLGWVCKLIKHPSINSASFCGIVSDPVDLINICDVRAYLADFGWTRQQYLEANQTTIKALIRAKGYSAIYQYPGCPIIDALGHYALRITDSDIVEKKMLKMYKKGHLGDSRFKNIKFQHIFDTLIGKIPSRIFSPDATRLLMESKFSVPVQKQIEIEDYLDNLQHITNLNIELDVPEVWRYTYDTFVNNVPIVSSEEQYIKLTNYLTSIGY